MSRPLRIEVPGGLYHVTSRGNERKWIFRDDADHGRFLDGLDQVCRRFGWRCLAYCLMGNHYHLVVETLSPSLSRGMRQLRVTTRCVDVGAGAAVVKARDRTGA